MIDPDALLDRLVETLRDIPDLVNLAGSAVNIYAYEQNYPASTNRFLAIQKMVAPSIMVARADSQITGRSRGIEHRFSAFLRPLGRAGPMFLALRDGIVTIGGQKLKYTQINPDCYPPDIQGLFARSLFITEQFSIDYDEIPIVLAERGTDH